MPSLTELLKQDLKDYQSIPFWSWNDKLEGEELKRQIRNMKDVGIGGFFMHARGGLMTEYLGEEWFEATKVCIDEAKAQNMNAWCYDENGWPSGFAGMKLLDDPANFAHYLTYEVKDSFDENALAVYIIENNKLVRVYRNQNTENSSSYLHEETDSSNKTSEPKDKMEQFHCVYDKTNSSVVDVLNADVVNKFIELTHEKYYERFKENFGNAMVGFFTDEPQYFRWGSAYTPVLLTAYPAEYDNDDVLDNLGALFVDCEQAYEFRFKYWRLMNKLYTNNFAKSIYNWCEKHNCKLTGHTIEEQHLHTQMQCSAGVMPFYEYEQIPGIDWLGRGISTEISPRQVSSVAQQLGKKQVLTETFACTGWDVTPKELKRIAEWQYVNGVNLMCQHLYPYSIRGQRKRDYPTFFSEHNPWTVDFKHFNDYFTALGFMLAESKEVADVAVIHPIHSAYLTYNREADYESVKTLEDNFQILVEKLGAANIGHHYVDELLLEKHGKVNGDKLIMGICEYSAVVIPKMDNLDHSTAKLLKDYVSNGGRIYLEGEKPGFVDGRKADLDFLTSNVSFDQLHNPDFEISDITTEIRSTFRKSDFGDFVFAVNLSEDREYSVDFKVKASSAKLFDLESRTERKLDFVKTTDGISIPMTFKPGQSFVIMLDEMNDEKTSENLQLISGPGNCIETDKADFLINTGVKGSDVSDVDEIKPDKSNSGLPGIDTIMKISGRTQNALTIDYVQISYDNIAYEPKMPIMAASYRLLKEQRNGKIFLKYSFDISEIPDSVFVECEKMDTSNIWMNGVSIGITGQGTLDRSFVRKDINNLVRYGLNEIVFELNYYQSEHVNNVLFGFNEGTESLMNCLSYDTDVEAIYILGDFDVISRNGYIKADKNTNVSDGDFTIAKSKKEIDTANIVEDGNPFFAGEITLEKTIEISNPNCKMFLNGRYSVAEVHLNGMHVAKLMFDNVCDLSGYARRGKNLLSIKLINSNRNLLGPFHCADDYEPYGVCPSTFDMYGTWANDRSPQYRDSYSFVKFGIDEIIIESESDQNICGK